LPYGNALTNTLNTEKKTILILKIIFFLRTIYTVGPKKHKYLFILVVDIFNKASR